MDLLLTDGLVITRDDDRAVRHVVLDDRKILGIDEADAIARAGAWPWA